MRPLILAKHLEVDESTRTYVVRRLQFALSRTLSRIGAITVRLRDENGPRGGIDKLCQILLVLPGKPTVVVSEHASSITAAVDKAAHSAAQAVRRLLDKEHQHRQRRALPQPV